MNAPLAIVTGATAPGRVGAAIARELLLAGCHVVVTHRPGASAERLAAAAAEISRGCAGSAVRFEALELADLDGVAGWARRMEAELPRVDVLVHNAAVYAGSAVGSDGQHTSESLNQMETAWRVNATAPLVLTRGLAGALRRSPMGRDPRVGAAVVTLCDAHALGPGGGQVRTGYAGYSMSKSALAELTGVLARELAPAIRVNGIAPGVVAFAADEGEAFQERYLSRVPLGRSGTPEEAARAVRFLALEATYCSGQILRLDGGRGLA